MMNTVASVLFSGIISFIVAILGTKYQFRKKELRIWKDDINLLIADIESNIDGNKIEICEKSNKWRRKCSELISGCPKCASENTLKYLEELLEKCESISNINPVPGGYNEEFNNKKEEMERISEDIKDSIR